MSNGTNYKLLHRNSSTGLMGAPRRTFRNSINYWIDEPWSYLPNLSLWILGGPIYCMAADRHRSTDPNLGQSAHDHLILWICNHLMHLVFLTHPLSSHRCIRSPAIAVALAADFTHATNFRCARSHNSKSRRWLYSNVLSVVATCNSGCSM